MTTKKRSSFGTKKRANLTDFEKSSIKDYKVRFAKWHDKQIDLLTFCINLNFTISIAIAGFIISNQDEAIFNDGLNCENQSLTKTALCLLALAATIGVVALISRLNNFRLTKNIIKTRRRIFELDNDIKYEDIEASEKENLKTQKDNLIWWTTLFGRMTLGLFYIQIILLLTALWMIVINA